MSKLTDELWAKRLADAARDGKLNISYMDLPCLETSRVLEIVGKIPNLVELDLRSNDLTDLPPELATLRHLRNVKLTYNKFETIPVVLTKLKRLTSLNMGGCLLRDVGALVGDLGKKVTDLDLSGNRIQSVHANIALCSQITYLNLENNSIAFLPETMGTMTALQVLDLSNNALGSLPDSFGGLTGLRRIEVNNNALTDLPPSMGHLRDLKEFDVRYNELREPGKTKAIGPLAGLLQFLRDEEQRLVQEEIERLKPIASQDGRYLRYRTKIDAKGGEDGNGGPSDMNDARPYLRNKHSLTAGANHLLIFGGTLSYHDKRCTNDLFTINLDRMVWRKVRPKGQKPCERDGHAAVFDTAQRRLLIFGGKSKEKKRLDDLFAYYLDEDRWVRLSPDGRRPDARESASLVSVDKNTSVLFGGKGNGQRFNDVCVLDMSSKDCSWHTSVTSGPAPTPRQDVAMASANGVVYVHAGRDNFVRDDLYSLDMTDKANPVWELLVENGRKPAPCYGHVLACVDGKVFTFGGFDELGGQCSKVYRLDFTEDLLSVAVAVDKSDGEWTEMESDLNLNESRIGAISPDGTLHVLQVGSKRSEADSATSGEEMFWDCYKVGEVLDFDDRVLRPEDLVPQNGKKLRVEHATQSKGKAYPPKIRARLVKNTEEEQKMLAYVAEFKNKFAEFYPNRRSLLLFAPNECGVPKFVCTTVRPSKLDYTQLYDLTPCCEFVANYLEYEQLESPLLFPKSLPSPYTVMEWQAGDCFDLATTLCSLLTGVGFDAYVCVGYAPKRITHCDQTGETCSVLELEETQRVKATYAKAHAPVPEKKQSKYQVKQLINLTSSLELADAKNARAEAKKAKEAMRVLKKLEREERVKQAVAEAAAADALEAETAAAAADAAAAASPGKKRPETETGTVCAEGAAENADCENGHPVSPAADSHQEHALEAVPETNDEGETGEEMEGDEPDPTNVGTSGPSSESYAASTRPVSAVDPAVEEARLDAKHEGKRVHAWVLVRAGAREVAETVFVEPTTARTYNVNASPYQGLEAVWNHLNLWVNKQRGTTVGAPHQPLLGMAFDLDDDARWEACLEVDTIEVPLHFGEDDEIVDEESTPGGGETLVVVETPATGKDPDPDPKDDLDPGEEEDKKENDDEAGDDDASRVSGTDATQTGDHGGDAADPLPEVEDGQPPETPENEYLDHDPNLVTVDMPVSWVPKLRVSQENFDTRCPRGHKLVRYAGATHEMFALFGPCKRWDGLVERLCVFQDLDCVVLKQERTVFNRRKDCLLERRHGFLGDEKTLLERFAPGAAFGVDTTELLIDRERHTVFFPGGRVDGLRTRHEVFGIKMCETFSGRDDFLVERKVTYDAEETGLRAAEALALVRAKDAAETASAAGGGHKKKNKKTQAPPPPVLAKVTQKFLLPDISLLQEKRRREDPDGAPVPPAQHWLKKRVFDLKNGTVKCHYHFGEGTATANVSVFHKDGTPCELTIVDPAADRPNDTQIAETFHKHRLAEKRCVADVRDVEHEADEIVKNRAKEEQQIELLLGYYDAHRVKIEDDDEEEVLVTKKFDYLSPFMPPLLAGEKMSANEASVARTQALANLAEELSTRREIIKKRQDDTNAVAGKRTAQYKRDADLRTEKEEAAYRAALEDTAFTLRLLEQRRKRHDANAERKVGELENTMRSDPRMAAMYA